VNVYLVLLWVFSEQGYPELCAFMFPSAISTQTSSKFAAWQNYPYSSVVCVSIFIFTLTFTMQILALEFFLHGINAWFFSFQFSQSEIEKILMIYYFPSDTHTLFFIVQHCTFLYPKQTPPPSKQGCVKSSVSQKNMSFCTLVLVPVVGVLLLLLCPGRAVSQRVLLLLVLLWQHAAAVVAASCRHPWQWHGPRRKLVGAARCRH